MISGFVLAWIVSVIATAPANEEVLVAQQGRESSKATTPSRSEASPGVEGHCNGSTRRSGWRY